MGLEGFVNSKVCLLFCLFFYDKKEEKRIKKKRTRERFF